jgi:hypothetical protein
MAYPRIALVLAVLTGCAGGVAAMAQPDRRPIGPPSPGDLVFGPKVYVRNARSSDPVTERFTACRPERRFQLRVENGPGQTRPVTGASIVLNGVEVLKPSDFTRTPRRLQRAVPLAGRNILGLRLSGRAGAVLSLAIVADAPCAAVRFASPLPGASVPAGEPAITGTLEGLPDAGVVVDGMPGFVEDAAFAAMVPETPEVTAQAETATWPDGTTVQVRPPLRVTAAAARARSTCAPGATGVCRPWRRDST